MLLAFMDISKNQQQYGLNFTKWRGFTENVYLAKNYFFVIDLIEKNPGKVVLFFA